MYRFGRRADFGAFSSNRRFGSDQHFVFLDLQSLDLSVGGSYAINR
jgi:hypothetical protein